MGIDVGGNRRDAFLNSVFEYRCLKEKSIQENAGESTSWSSPRDEVFLMARENLRNKRLSVSIPVLCSVNGMWQPARLNSMTAGGLSLTGLLNVQNDDKVLVQLPCRNVVYDFPARVRCCTTDYVGLVFEGLPKRRAPDWLVPTEPDGRRANRRHSVQLKVNFGSDFADQYAENLSNGGLFVRGAPRGNVGDRFGITISLVGNQSFPLVAELVRIIEPSKKQDGGMGFAILSSTPDFQLSASKYIERLHVRQHFTVLSETNQFDEAINVAGFQSQLTEQPSSMDKAFVRLHGAVAGIIVPSSNYSAYERIAERMGYRNLLIPSDDAGKSDQLIQRLDQNIFS